jgi:hypothetical protein
LHDKKKYYERYLTILQKDADAVRLQEEQEQMVLKNGVNFTDPQYSALPLNFASMHCKSYKAITLKSSRK